MDDLLKRIVIDPRVMAGKPVIRGTRIAVDQVLELLAAGMILEEIAEDYGIDVDDVKAAYYMPLRSWVERRWHLKRIPGLLDENL